jgi:hypothetical protein
MKCPNCSHELGMEDSIPKSIIRKWLNDMIETTSDDDVKIKALAELNRLEQYTGTNVKKDLKKVGVFIVQESMLKKGPGKSSGGELPKPA